jgi:hypothetical protein
MKLWRIILTRGVPTTILMTGFLILTKGTFNLAVAGGGISAGAVGVLFGFIEYRYFKLLGNKLAASIPEIQLVSGERLLLKGGASHYKGKEAVGGKLFLTNKRLLFNSHRFNIQNHVEEIQLEEIQKFFKERDKILFVHLKNQHTHRFLVEQASQWINAFPLND